MQKHLSARLAMSRLGAYVLPALPISALGLPLVVYLPPFYVEELALSNTVVGMIFLATRLGDAFFDVGFGVVSDRYDMRWGRRRTWMAISLPLLMVPIYLLFLPPEHVTPLYLVLTLSVAYIGYSFATISHMSWGTELTPDYHERSRIHGWREAALIFGMFTVLTLPAIYEFLAPGHPTGRDKIAAMGWYILALLPLTFAIALFFVPDHPAVRAKNPIAWRPAVMAIFKNAALMRLLVVDVLVGLAPGVTGSLYVFLVSYAFDLPQWASLLLLVYFVAGVFGVPVWIWLSRKFGKHRTFTYAMIYATLGLPLIYLVPPGGFWFAFAANVVFGLAYGSGAFLLRSIMADVTDQDSVATGEERTGVFYALFSLTQKAGYAVAIGITYPLLDLFGFQAGTANTPEAIDGLRFIYVVLPSLFLLASAALMWNFPLDEVRQSVLRAELALARAARGRPD